MTEITSYLKYEDKNVMCKASGKMQNIMTSWEQAG